MTNTSKTSASATAYGKPESKARPQTAGLIVVFAPSTK